MLAHSCPTVHRSLRREQAGFSLVELLITLTLAVLIGIIFFTFFHTSLLQYLNIQQNGNTATNLAGQENRVATVLRGTTSIVSASGNDLVLYSYFYPSDANVSLLHYYVSNGQLLADLTPMSANPPTGIPLTANKKTYVIIPNLYQVSGGAIFSYNDSGGNALGTPVSDVNTVQTIQVNLAATLAGGGNEAMNVQVNLRNRKTNL